MVVPADPSKEFKMTRWIAFALLPVMGALFDAPPGHAQAAAKRPAFEVASIKPDKDCDPRKDGGSNSPGRLNLVCRTPRQDIELAYADLDGPHERWPRLEVVGGPHWLGTDQYDIFAKAEGPAPYWQMASLMLQSLLEQRFNLKLRTESRITSRYDLTVVRSDPRLKRTPEGECIAQDSDNPQPMAPPDPRVKPGDRVCGRTGSSKFVGPNVVADWYGFSMAQFAGLGLPSRVGFRPVVDKTGLTGIFDIHLEYSRELGPNEAARPDADVIPKPDIFRALQEQLGLKLAPDKAPVDVIVIDSVDRPSEN